MVDVRLRGDHLLRRTPNTYIGLCDLGGHIREGCRKSKWKFKITFAMKGGGFRGGLECHIPILKNDFY